MPITWRYTDVCGVIICYITEHLEDLFDGVCGAVEIHKIDVW